MTMSWIHVIYQVFCREFLKLTDLNPTYRHTLDGQLTTTFRKSRIGAPIDHPPHRTSPPAPPHATRPPPTAPLRAITRPHSPAALSRASTTKKRPTRSNAGRPQNAPLSQRPPLRSGAAGGFGYFASSAFPFPKSG